MARWTKTHSVRGILTGLVAASVPWIASAARAEEAAAPSPSPSAFPPGATSSTPPDASKPEAAKPEPAKPEAAKPEPAKPEAAHVGLEVSGFVDAYASVNANFPKPAVNALRAYDGDGGFALHWVGLDATIGGGALPIGATINLRFGPSAPLYAGYDEGKGLAYVKQAYATWKPLSALTLDFGKYDQPFGSEVADSQGNPSYTRSALYWFAQPLFFTGLRAGYAFSEKVELKVFAVNGWNVTVDRNAGKSVGAQVILKPISTLSIFAGWLGGPEQADSIRCDPGQALDAATGSCATSAGAPGGAFAIDGANGRWRHLGDLVLDWQATPRLRVLFNADYGTEKLIGDRERFYGANLLVGYTLSDVWSLALRGDWLHDAKGAMTATNAKTTIVDGTLTLGAKPHESLLLKLDLRLDHATVAGAPDGVFPKGASDVSKWQPTATLGIVAKTN
jgi:hypothetical protein